MRSLPLSAFDAIPSVAVQVASTITTGQLPSLDEVRSMAHWTRELTDKFGRTAEFFAGPPKQDRSAALAELAYLGAENRWSDEQLYVALSDADTRWGKYVGRRDRERRLVDFINRARTKIGYDPAGFADVDLDQMFAPAKGDDGKITWDLRKFLAAEFTVDWVLEGLHPRQGLGLITGFPGIGKTTFGLGMAFHLAGQEQQFLHWPVRADPQRVLFLSLEMGKYTIHHFISTIAGPYDDLAIDNFTIAPLGQAMALDTEAGQQLFESLLEDTHPDVVLIDSMQKISSKELSDETATKELMQFLAGMRAKYDCSMLVIHHMRKKSNGDQARHGVELSDVYGSVYLTAEPDWVLNLRGTGEEDPNLLKMTMLKTRLGRNEPESYLRRSDRLGFSLEGDGGGIGGYSAA